MLTGRVVKLGEAKGSSPAAVLKRLVARSGEPFIRKALRQAMRILGDNFVLGRTIEEALTRAAPLEAKGYRFSYDMLGERAKTAKDAERYFDRYVSAIEAVSRAAPPMRGAPTTEQLLARPSISVKLSALHPRFDPGKEHRLARELLPRLVKLAEAARCAAGSASPSMRRSRTGSTSRWGCSPPPSPIPALAGWPGLGLGRAGLRQARDPGAALAAAAGARIAAS